MFTNSFSDEAGMTTRAPFAANFPLEVMNTVLFSEKDGKTTLYMTGTPFNASEEEKTFFESMFPVNEPGLQRHVRAAGRLSQAGADMSPARELTMMRVHDAPRDLVFRAWTHKHGRKQCV